MKKVRVKQGGKERGAWSIQRRAERKIGSVKQKVERRAERESKQRKALKNNGSMTTIYSEESHPYKANPTCMAR